MLFLVACSLLLVAFGIHQALFLRRRRRTSGREWNDLVASMEEVNLEAIREIADMFLNPTKDQLRLEPPVMWQMLGGLQGVHRLSKNAETMLEICVFSERWDFQGPVVSEMIRLDAINLNKAVRRIELGFVMNLGVIRGHFALMEVAAHYDLIRRRLRGQYEKAHAGRLPLLKGI